MAIGNFLQEPDRRWHRRPGASDAEIQRLVSAVPVPLPASLIELLRFSNGGEGPLALPPRVFCLSDVDFIVECAQDAKHRGFYPGLFFFGDNGGLERLALDLRGGAPPWPILMMNPVGGNDTAVVIAKDFDAFMKAVGRSRSEEGA